MPRPPQPLWRSFQVAIHGWTDAIAEQRNIRFHLAMAMLVIGLAAWLGVSLVEWLLLALCVGNVLAIELINTAIETVVDLVSPEHHDLARKAKDISAAAVLTVSVMAAIIGALILLAPLFNRG